MRGSSIESRFDSCKIITMEIRKFARPQQFDPADIFIRKDLSKVPDAWKKPFELDKEIEKPFPKTKPPTTGIVSGYSRPMSSQTKLNQALVDNATGKAGMEVFMAQAKDPHSRAQQEGYARLRFGDYGAGYAQELARYAERGKPMPKTAEQMAKERAARDLLTKPKPTPIVNTAKTMEQVREEQAKKPKKPIRRIPI